MDTPEHQGKGTNVGGACELTVGGSIARSVLDAVGTRFDVRAVRFTDRPPGRTVLTVAGVDQSAVRALMIMLWDSGHDVLAMSTVAEQAPTRLRG